MNPSDRWLTSDQAAAALGVRRSTLYSYVSRGLVTRGFARDSAGHRVSTFDRSQVVALAAARTRPRAGALPVLIESDVSALDPDGTLTLRGRPVGDVVAAGSFEDAAALVLQAGPGWPSLPLPGGAPLMPGRVAEGARTVSGPRSWRPRRAILSAVT